MAAKQGVVGAQFWLSNLLDDVGYVYDKLNSEAGISIDYFNFSKLDNYWLEQAIKQEYGLALYKQIEKSGNIVNGYIPSEQEFQQLVSIVDSFDFKDLKVLDFDPSHIGMTTHSFDRSFL